MHNTAHSPLHQSKNLNLLACIKQIKPGCTSAMVDNCIPKSSKMNDLNYNLHWGQNELL